MSPYRGYYTEGLPQVRRLKKGRKSELVSIDFSFSFLNEPSIMFETLIERKQNREEINLKTNNSRKDTNRHFHVSS